MPSTPATPLLIGVDVGGTKVLGIAISPPSDHGHGGVAAAVVAEAERPTEHGEGALAVIDAVINDLFTGIGPPVDGPLRASARVEAIGVGMPGLVDRHGVLRFGPNLDQAEDLDVAARLAARALAPVVVDNDGNCAAWGEHLDGAGRGADELVFVGLGTGISCGLVVAGRRVRGVHGFAGEPGHMTVVPGGPRCACGRRGCWETLASGSALAAQAVAVAAAGMAPALVELAGGDPAAVRGEHVSAGLEVGDAAARAIAERFADWVTLGVANLVHLLDPQVVVLGGSVLQQPELWMPFIDAAYAHAVLGGSLRTGTVLAPARLGRRAGALGAALLAGEHVAEVPGTQD